jgi:hypothetical protein
MRREVNHVLRLFRPAENVKDCAFEALPARDVNSFDVLFQIFKEEEVARNLIWIISWLWHPPIFYGLETITGPRRIVSTCSVQVCIKTVQWSLSRVWAKAINQTRQNDVTKGCWAVPCHFRHVNKTMDPVYIPQDRNQTFFGVKCLLGACRTSISKRFTSRIIKMTGKQPRLIPTDNLFEILSLFQGQELSKVTGKGHTLLLLTVVRSFWFRSEMKLLQFKPLCRIRRHMSVTTSNCRAKT